MIFQILPNSPSVNMAGDDEELSLLLSSIPDHSQEAEINNLLFSVQSMETGDMISQLLNSQDFYTSEDNMGAQVVRDKERSVSLSVSSPESGLGSEELDIGAVSPGAAWDTVTVEPVQTTGEQIVSRVLRFGSIIIVRNYFM